uniref:Plastid acyl carrier protein n=1 Tax=Pseudellipsoidion edaphicum TaxID=1431838 RepID=A0A3R5QKQ4_9STRA|nr:plastid acyl carrier protein [Pseudellipsoidion edaphicum]
MRTVFRSLILVAGLVGSSAFLPPMVPNSIIVSRQLPVMMAGGDEAGVSEKVRALVLKNSGDDPKVAEYLTANGDDKANFLEMGFDSLDLAEFSMALQSEFELADLDDEALATFKTVGDVVTYIAKK